MKKDPSAVTASLLACGLCLLGAMCFPDGAYASETSGPAMKTFRPISSDRRPCGQNLPLLAASPSVGREQTSSDVRLKSPLAAGLLGGLLGYGSGQYYSRKWTTGTAFLLIDGLGTFLLARGVDIVNSDSGPTNLPEIEEDTAKGLTYLSFGAVILAGSHVAQAILGPRAARKHNQASSGAKAVHLSPFVQPGFDSVELGFSARF